MPDVRNLFTGTNEASRYNTFRPHYHDIPCGRLRSFFGQQIGRTLDVACGTGHSTRSLAKISNSVVGCDLSTEMLEEARKFSDHEYILAPAESLPFDAGQFDYVNVSMAFHWLNQDQFLSEAKRVLSTGGHLGIDNYGFTGEMKGFGEFKALYKNFDQDFMRSAPRNKNYPENEAMISFGFEFVQEFEYEHPVEMSQTQFVNYLKTRSNYLDLPATDRTVVNEKIGPFYAEAFCGEQRVLNFAGKLKLFRV